MKKILYTAIGLISIFTLASCEKYLTVKPHDKVAAQTFFNNEQELELFANGMLNSYRPGATDIALGDQRTDICSVRDPAKFWYPNDIYIPSDRSAWSYTNVRRANVLINNMERAKGKVSEEVYNHYQGVGRVWRAYFHFEKVITYGDIPWQDKLVDPADTTLLYAKRDDRELVVHNCIEDLKFAVEHCFGDDTYKGKINKWIAATYLSRIALYEGTFRKYFDVNPSTYQPWNNYYETADDLLRIACEAAEVVINSGKFSLAPNYKANFITKNLLSNPEMIWVSEYSDEDGVMVTHELTSTFRGTNTTAPSPTKNYVRQFLMKDGTPITTDELSLYEELSTNNNRDPRLNMCVNHIGHTYAANSGETLPKYMPCNLTSTGYNLIKWNLEEENQFNVSKCANSIPIMRYAEVLLNYAEAKAELGEMDDAVWNATVGKLRGRVGVETARPSKVDPMLYKYYADAYDYEEGDIQGNRAAELKSHLTADLVEIRRERVAELGFEGFRYDDLQRWHCLSLVPMRGTNGQGAIGIWVSKEDFTKGFLFNPIFMLDTDGKSKKDYELNPSGEYEYVGEGNGRYYVWKGEVRFANKGNSNENTFIITNTGGQQSYSLSNGDHGYMIFNYPLEWNVKKYLYPINSTNVLAKNPNIVQNYGW